MRVALVYRSFHRAGSLPGATVEMARHLSSRHEVHVFSIGALTENALAPGCVFHDVPVSGIAEGGRFSARELGSFASNAAKLVSREQFDVVHACAPSTWVSDVLNVPGIARAEAELQGIPAWRYAVATIRHPGDAVRRWLEQKAINYPGLRRIHAAAPSVKESLGRRYGVRPDDVLVVTPAVNTDTYRPASDKDAARHAAGVADDGVVLLFCGSDFARKGLDRAILAVAQARAKTTLLVVGNGPETEYRKLAAAHRVEDRVRFLGSRTDAWRVYQAADILLLPTHADVWGVTPIEAMATGIPPVVTEAAGSAVTLETGRTGIVLPEPFDQRALTDAVERLATDAAERERMGRAGIAVAAGHSWARRLEQVEADLVAVAERRSGAEGVGRRKRQNS